MPDMPRTSSRPTNKPQPPRMGHSQGTPCRLLLWRRADGVAAGAVCCFAFTVEIGWARSATVSARVSSTAEANRLDGFLAKQAWRQSRSGSGRAQPAGRVGSTGWSRVWLRPLPAGGLPVNNHHHTQPSEYTSLAGVGSGSSDRGSDNSSSGAENSATCSGCS